MLVLTRRENESFDIEGGIRVTIVGIDRGRGRVRVGIEAPPHLKILRTELEITAEGIDVTDYDE